MPPAELVFVPPDADAPPVPMVPAPPAVMAPPFAAAPPFAMLPPVPMESAFWPSLLQPLSSAPRTAAIATTAWEDWRKIGVVRALVVFGFMRNPGA
jgi:hypothetical protein